MTRPTGLRTSRHPPGWRARPPPPEVTGIFPLPVDLISDEPPPRRRHVVLLAAAPASIVAAVAAAVVVLGSPSAHKPTATKAHVSAQARAPATWELTMTNCGQGIASKARRTSTPSGHGLILSRPFRVSRSTLRRFTSSPLTIGPMGKAYPGRATIIHQARAECRKAFHTYDGITLSRSELSFIPLSPWPRVDWHAGDRMLLCTAYEWTKADPGGQSLYGSIKGSAS